MHSARLAATPSITLDTPAPQLSPENPTCQRTHFAVVSDLPITRLRRATRMREVLARRERIHRLQFIPYRLHALLAHIGRALPEESTGHGISIPAGAVPCAKLLWTGCPWRERIFPVCRLRSGTSGVTRMQRLPCRLLPSLGCTPCLARFRSRSQVVGFGNRNRLYCAFVAEHLVSCSTHRLLAK